MAKRIFKILGIVLGSTIGLVSVVFGTLAILGKFKTPIVYPERLYFESDQKIIVGEKDASGAPSEIYSFILKADGEIDGQGVNQKDCLLTVSSNLITICDKDGNKVEQDVNKRYKIKCNEETYFKLSALPQNNQNSSVTLSAITNHSGTPKVADNTMTIMVDQKINSFEIVSTNSTILTSDNKTTQYITIGTGDKLPIQYITNPEISQQPINSKSAKLFDLYFDRSTAFDKTNLTDISLVNAETLNSQDTKYDDIKSMFEIDSGILTFKAIQPGTYKFKVLVFDTYENRENFDNNLLNSENFVGKNNQEIINELLSQSETGAIINDVEIVVKDVFVNSVVMENTIVSLPLFGEKIVSMADLGITMDVGANDPSSRFTSAKFGAFSDDDFSDAIPEFINDNGDKIYWGEYTENGSEGFYSYNANGEKESKTASVSGSTFKINDTYQMVDHITVNSEEYYCNNGLAVVDSSNSIKLLNEGTYVSFYTLKDSTLTLYSDDNISVEDLGGIGAKRKWKFTANTNVDGLKIGVLVVNKGKTILNDNFKCNANVTIFEETFAINYTDKIKNANFTQTLTYSIDEDGGESYNGINVSDLIAPTGSYNKCVLVVESGKNKNITTLGEDYKFTKDGKTYEIVGYFDNGVFQNALKFKGEGSNEVDQVYVAQLWSEGENLGLTDLLNKINTERKTAYNYVKSIDTQAISVNTVCQIDGGLLDWFVNETEISESNPLYEQSKAQLKINIKDSVDEDLKTKFAKICEFYGFEETAIEDLNILKNFFTSEATINSAKYDEKNGLVITFTTPVLSAETEREISIKIKGFVSTEKEVSVSVLSSQPDSVVFKYRDGENTLTYTLKDNIDDATAKSNKNSLVITASFNGSVYEYSYKFVDSNGDGHDCENSPFNTEILSGGLYFQADEFKSVAYQINYGSGDTSIFNATDLTDMDQCALKAGETYLSVQIGDKIGYLKLKVETNLSVDTSDLSVSQDGIISASITSGQSLKDIYPIKYNGSTDFISKDYTSLSNFVVSYGGGELTFDDTDYFVWENGNGETILEISFDNSNGWTFTRKTDLYGQLEISFDVTTKLETRRINLTFTSDIVAKTNYASWGKDLKIYDGTTVQLVESYFDSASTQAMFLIKKMTGGAEKVNVYVNNASNETLSNTTSATWTPTTPGTYTIKITTTDGGIIIEREVKVVPNVIAKNDTAEITCEQEISDAINAFNLYSMPTGFTYGSTKNSENNIILYSNQTLGKISDTTSLNLGVYDKDNTPMTSIPWVEAIGEIEEKTVTLKSGDNIIESDLTLKILNPYAIEFNETEIVANKTDITSIYTLYKQTTVSSDNFDTLKDSLYVYNSENGKFESVSGEFSDKTVYYEKITLTYNGAEIIDSTGTNIIQTLESGVKKLSNVVNIYENAQLIISFMIDGKYSKATATVKISPWTPERTKEDGYNKSATAGSNFNLIDDVFNVEDISNISSLKAKGIYDNDGNGITDIYCSGFSVSGIDGGVNAGCVVAMNNIRGASTTVYVEYDLIYLGQTEPYTFRVPLTIKNQTEIVITRPTGNEYKLATANISLQYNDESNETQTFVNNNSVYYEPIAVSTAKGLTIDVLNADYLGVQRIGTTDGAIESLTLVAYQSGNATFTTYAGAISVSGSEIIFPQASMRGMTGYVIFKVETQSRNYDFLTFYIYSISSTDTSTSAVDPTKNINIKVDTTKTISSILGTSGATISGVDGEGNATSLAVVDLSKVEVYVVDEKCETKTYESQFTKYEKLDTTKEITQPDNYVTLKLALVYNNGGNARYALGTVTLYLTPSVYVTGTTNISPEISTTTGLTTGVFTGTIENTVTSVDSPFTLSSGTISSVELYKANSTEDDIVKNVEILDVLKDTSKYAISTGDNKMFNITTDKITINKKTTSDYTFWAKYTSGDLVLWVKYTLKATTINDDSSFTIGSFDTTNGFVDTIYLKDILGYESSDLTIKSGDYAVDEENSWTSLGVKYDSTNKKLQFNLTEKASTINLTFTLNDVIEDGNPVIRNYTFHVRPACEIIVSTNNEGNSASTPVSSKVSSSDVVIEYEVGKDSTYTFGSNVTSVSLVKTDNNITISGNTITITESALQAYKNSNPTHTTYNNGAIDFKVVANGVETTVKVEFRLRSDVGSTLTIQESVYPKGATGENIKYYIYTIGGINVYTKSEMSITGVSDTNKFVIASGGNVVNDYTINFAHNAIHDTADIEKITLTFKKGSMVYTTKEIYVNVIPTYARIEAVYLNDGADHENVLGGDKFSVNNLLTAISDRYRVKLIGTDNSKKGLDLSEMGFMTSGNPNKITISNASANATVNADKDTITFDSASAENKDAKVTFSYNGLTFDYNFKIMASKYNDNLDPFIVEMSEDFGISDNDSVSIVNASATSSTSKDGYVYIGQLGDNDGNLFTITSLDSSATLTKTEKLKGGDSLSITSNVGDITIYEGVKYTITANDRAHNILFDATNHKLYARIVDFNGNDKTSFSVTATGTTSKIMNGFTFNFLNVTITENYTSSAKVVYGGGYLDVFKQLTASENVNTDYLFNSNSDLTFKIDTGKSTYNVGGTGDIELSNDPYGNLVALSGNRLTFAEVGQETTITLALTAKLGSTNIKTVYAKIKIIPNLQFIMNGDAYSGGGTTQSFETELVLKTDNTTAFEDTASGVAGITVKFVDKCTTANSNNGKFTQLVYNLYDLSGNDLGIITNINIEAKPGTVNEQIKISNSSITFKDDYDGYVYLIVSYLTDYGTYSVNWTIHVTPILQLEYASSNQIVSGASGSIKSGETITILSDVVDTTLAVKATLPDTFASISLDDSKTDVSVTANYKTFIASEENRTLEKKNLYENGTNQTTYGSGSSGLTNNGNVWTTTLPAVPVSAIGNANNYYVVYKISISYLGKTVDKYVAYYAYNESSVTAYNYTSGSTTYSSASVNVDDDVTDNFLPLFTQDTSAKDGTQVFTHEYSSEGDYNDFIASIDAVKIVNQDGEIFYFALKNTTISEITYYGIDLAKAFDSESDVTDSTKAKTKSLFTNKLEGVLSCMSSGAEIVSLSGFELTTSSTIESIATTTYTLENIFGSVRVPSKLDKTTEILAITNISTLGEEDADGKLITASTNATLLGYVKNANKITKFKEISTITGDYKLYSITYSGSSDSQIYSISKSFYVVYSSTGDVSIVDYPTNKKSFVVQYVGNASIDLSNAVRYFKMNNNVIEKVEIISNISTDIDIDDNKIRIEKVNDTTYTGKITIYESELQDYKNNNPTATTYQGGPITFNVIIDGNEFKVAVEFRLPSTTTS